MNIIDIILNAAIPFEIICALIGTYYLFFTKDNNLKIIVPYLWVVVIVEILGFIIRSRGENNVFLYNFLSTFEFCIWSIVYYKNSANSNTRAVIKILSIIGIIGILLDFIFTGGYDPFIYLTYGITFLRLIIVIYCCIYILSLVKDNRITKLKPIGLFWISIGLLTFNACIIPFTGFLQLTVFDSEITELLFLIPSVLSYGMYTLFILGFIWGNQQKI